MSVELVIGLIGFLLAAYSVVANDAIQTLGTFLASNAKRPWWVLWIYASSILVVVLVLGWFLYGGDVSYGRLEKFPFPPEPYGMQWYYAVPPLAILVLTRFGIPVSTTFLVLTVFSTSALGKMLGKSMLGYALAFVVGILVYKTVMKMIEQRFLDTTNDPPPNYWIVIQWCSTAFLWSQWLIQDLANIYVFLARPLDATWMILTMFVMVGMQGIIFYQHGGAIQKIVTSKTNTKDIRSASIIDFIYGLILFFFKQLSNIPMSTTWVFLGLLAGRELALTIDLRMRPMKDTGLLIVRDMGKALIGLAVSVILAIGLPWLAKQLF
jgi:hypothetical protein